MGKKIKKGKKGEKSQYLTRSKAIRKLQLTLKDFRRLCILKGVYPREPKRKFEGTNKTYYHIKDLKILMHDKLLQKFRDIKAHLKKYKKLLGKKEKKLAEDHLKKTPKYTLSHIIKERYPTFIDALRDLDDALCMMSLFANLPQHETLEISKHDIEVCDKLVKEFQLYCTITQCYKKAFFSIKGIYYQVEIMGQSITWIAPYQFNQRLPFDVDYKVMTTFLEFYQALLKFINFKLYSDLSIAYPPQNYYGETHLNVLDIKNLQKAARKKFDQGKHQGDKYQISEEFKDTPEMKKLTKKEEVSSKQRELFKQCVFLLNRETPVQSLQYLILSFGGVFATEEDKDFLATHKVTHHVLDRPLLGKMQTNREYVQPQWIVDSLNNLHLLPISSYKPGVAPPPHLSPFVDNSKEGYVPSRQKEINQLKGEEIDEEDMEDEEQSSSEEEKEEVKKPLVKTKQAKPQQKQAVEQKQDKHAKPQQVQQEKKQTKQQMKGDADTSSEEEDDSEEENEKLKKIKHQKIKKELKKEQEELGKILMSKKQRRLYDQADKNLKQKKDMVQKLKDKKKKLASQQHK